MAWLALAAPTLTLAQPASPAASSPAAQPLRFVALGDMPYQPDMIAGPAYRQLISLINDARPAFSVHVGDFKDGYSPCTDLTYASQAAYFQRFEGALVYTPGDNDWLDCQRRGEDPLQRLQALRQRFFAGPQSLGQRPIDLQRQSDLMPPFAAYRENQRWQQAGVLFATFHTVGPNNGSEAALPAVRLEAQVREAANAAWIRSAFALAQAQGAHALVLATQADALVPGDPERPSARTIHPAFATSFGQTLLPLAAAAPFPVLLIHGDSHHYKTDQPFNDAQGRPIRNLWRLQVFGDPRMHAVRVQVLPPAASVAGGLRVGPNLPFLFTPIWNPLSPDPRLVVR